MIKFFAFFPCFFQLHHEMLSFFVLFFVEDSNFGLLQLHPGQGAHCHLFVFSMQLVRLQHGTTEVNSVCLCLYKSTRVVSKLRVQILYPPRQSPVRRSFQQNSRSYSNFSQSPNVTPHENNSFQQNTQFSAYPQTIVRPHVQETVPLITGNFSFQTCPRNPQILSMNANFSVKEHGLCLN